MGYAAVAFILLCCFIIWKLLRFGFRLLRNSITSVIDSLCAFHDEKKNRVVFPEYSISQNEFSKIAVKIAYRHPRIDDVTVSENRVSIVIISQTGFSKSHADITFVLTGSNIGAYRITRDNYETTVPEKIADKIRMEIRKQAGIIVI